LFVTSGLGLAEWLRTNNDQPFSMANFLLVFLGGGLGSICRYGIGLLIQPQPHKFPWATLMANGLACLVLGIVLGLHLQGNLSDQRKLLLATGFCGGFSTFSTFTAETWYYFQNAQYGTALANVAGSLTVCFVCLLLGIKLTA
jgi:CrcB protein